MEKNTRVGIIGYGFVGKATEYFLHWCKPETDISIHDPAKNYVIEDWNNIDYGGFPYFAIGANYLCDSVATCVAESDNFELSLDQFYYSFPVFSPQNCDSTTTSLDKSIFPHQYNISAPYPNPFNPTVRINLNIPYDRRLTIQIYNSVGQEVNAISINKYFTTGTHSIYWNGSKYPSGVYYIKFSDGFETKIRKILLLK